jgi:hypothetical protein
VEQVVATDLVQLVVHLAAGKVETLQVYHQLAHTAKAMLAELVQMLADKLTVAVVVLAGSESAAVAELQALGEQG